MREDCLSLARVGMLTMSRLKQSEWYDHCGEFRSAEGTEREWR